MLYVQFSYLTQPTT